MTKRGTGGKRSKKAAGKRAAGDLSAGRAAAVKGGLIGPLAGLELPVNPVGTLSPRDPAIVSPRDPAAGAPIKLP